MSPTSRRLRAARSTGPRPRSAAQLVRERAGLTVSWRPSTFLPSSAVIVWAMAVLAILLHLTARPRITPDLEDA